MEQILPQTVRSSDEMLVGRILSGEKRLYEHIMRANNQKLYRIGMSILAHDMEVEDAMQSAYITAYENLHKFEFRSSFNTWLTRIMLNECLGRKKKRVKYKTEINHQLENQVTMTTPANALVNKELGGVLENAISQLPDKYRLVFVLREIEEMSVRDTSETLDIAEANVKTRLNRAKSMLRDSLSGYMRDNVYAFNLIRCDRIVNNVLAHLKIA